MQIPTPNAAAAHVDWTAEDPDPLINEAERKIREEVARYIRRKLWYLFKEKPLHEIPELEMRKGVPTARILVSKDPKYADFRKVFEGFGVTEANVQTALYIAKEDPERAEQAISAMPFVSLARTATLHHEKMDLLHLLDRFSKVDITKIDELKRMIESVYRQIVRAGFERKDFPHSLRSLFDEGEDEDNIMVDDAQLSTVTNPTNFAEEWKADLNLKTFEEYEKEFKEAEEKLKKLAEEGVTGVSAPEAVRAVYQAYFTSDDGGGLSPGRAEDAARQLYAENEVGALEVEVAKKAIDMMLGYGPPKRDGNILLPTKEYLKGWAVGSSRSYIKNLAESIGVGGRFYPAWEEIAGDRPKLLIAYHALQESIKRGYLPDTREVRHELTNISILLLKASERDVTDMRQRHEFSKGNGENPNETKILRQSNERHMRYGFIRSILFRGIGDIPSDHYGKGYYCDGIEHAINHARTQTGKWRRGIGTAAYAPMKYLVVKPTAAIIGGTVGVVKFGGGLVKKSISSSWQFAKAKMSRLNTWLFHEKSPIIGSFGGGHH